MEPRTESQSTFAHALSVSGYAGVAVGLCLEFYRLYLTDSALGIGGAPPWVELSVSALVVGSVITVLYARILDDIFEVWKDLVVTCVLLGQWGVSLGAYLDATVGGPGTPYGFLVVACAGVYALVAVVVAVNYLRRGPTATTDGAVRRVE